MGTSFVRLWTCKTGLISERLTRDPLGRLWMCKTGSISERLTRDPLGRPWTCKTGSIFECLIRTPLGRLLDMQNWFNIRTSDRDPSWTSSGHAELVQYLNVWQGPLLDIFWTCKTGSISVFLSRSHLGRLWTCKIISISERLTRDPHGCLWMCNTSNSNSHPAPMCSPHCSSPCTPMTAHLYWPLCQARSWQMTSHSASGLWQVCWPTGFRKVGCLVPSQQPGAEHAWRWL